MQLGDRHYKFINDQKNLLMKNNLDDFYYNTAYYDFDPEEVGILTAWLEEQGVKVMDYFKDTIPDYCFYDITVPSHYIYDGYLTFPEHIQFLSYSAFAAARGFSGVDLRHIKVTDEECFAMSNCTELIMDMEYHSLGRDAFYTCHFDRFAFPEADWDDYGEEAIKDINCNYRTSPVIDEETEIELY